MTTLTNAGAGTILSAQWGYDQTNINFFEVLSVTPKTLVIREIAKTKIESFDMADFVVPAPGEYIGKPMRRKIQDLEGRQYVKINSCTTASIWEGELQLMTSWG